MRVISKEVQYSETGNGRMYCIKGEKLYIFAIDNFSWSLAIKSEDQLEKSMKLESSFQGFKDKMIQTMREMMKEF